MNTEGVKSMIKNKKAKRLLAGVLGMATLLVVFLVGCGKKDDNLKDNKYIKVLPDRIKDDEYIICTNTYNMNIIDGISSYTSVGLKVLSDKPIESKDVNAEVATNNGYEVSCSESQLCEGLFDEYICLIYNNTDWKEFSELELSNPEEFAKMKDEITKEYSRLKESDFPSYYVTNITVSFNDIKEEEVINSIDVDIKGNKKTVDIGNVRLIKLDEEFNVGEYALEANGIFIGMVNIQPNKDGTIKPPRLEYNAKDDVIIKNISLIAPTEGTTIDSIEVESLADDNAISQKWKDGMELPVKAGETIGMDIVLKDEEFVGKLAYTVNEEVLVEYEQNGNLYATKVGINCETRHSEQLLYAIYKDNLGEKVQEYFKEYLKR